MPVLALAQPALVGEQISADAGSLDNTITFDFLGDGAGVVAGEAQLTFSSADLVITDIVCRLPMCASNPSSGRLLFFSFSLTAVDDTADAIEVTFDVASAAPAGMVTLRLTNEIYSDMASQPVASNGSSDGAVVVDRVPIARDDMFTMKEDGGVLSGDLRQNNGHGIDELGNPPYEYLLAESASRGLLTLMGDQGLFSYRPDANVSGIDMAGYTIVDSNGQSSDVGMITVVIDPTPDPVDDLVLLDDAGIVVDGQVTTDNGLGADDLGNGPSLVIALDPPQRAASFALAGDGSFSYEPDATFTHSDHFTYVVTDADGDQGPAAMVTVLLDPIFGSDFESAMGSP